ncbi:unnamed protein product [Tilletia controversa]|uniref:Uncharacterized protein n=3 Tax=Tilletia TaxID=13289 RepID=A0A8X7MNF0_9BASI|nr:hypothetical protein CF336_g7316 [Tilletia laevis]KAE8187244.1 hypothetical protein CF328_g6978 [Tilletia controversa]KAE8252017.1 hypothetical protein A4X03_0g6269 [Tilletia caries]KAE8190666.1 hypothetical protein CF335_g6297 [Tilletia laevis]KAE8242959.1 hypothetical protein A4X06_0g6652 [Tilletia controversa]
MLAATFIVLASTFSVAFVEANFLEVRRPLIACKEPRVVGSLLLEKSSGKTLAPSFHGVTDSKSRALLTTSVKGHRTPGSPFRFTECSSGVMPETGAGNPDGSITYYGQLRSDSQPDQCVTAATIGRSSPTTELVSQPCSTTDNSGLISQWFALTEHQVLGKPSTYALNYVGKTAFSTDNSTYGWTSARATNGARQIELVYSKDGNISTGYSATIRP